MQPIDQARVVRVLDVFKYSRIKAHQLLYTWVKNDVINFETFYAANQGLLTKEQERVVRFNEDKRE